LNPNQKEAAFGENPSIRTIKQERCRPFSRSMLIRKEGKGQGISFRTDHGKKELRSFRQGIAWDCEMVKKVEQRLEGMGVSGSVGPALLASWGIT